MSEWTVPEPVMTKLTAIAAHVAERAPTIADPSKPRLNPITEMALSPDVTAWLARFNREALLRDRPLLVTLPPRGDSPPV